jgi:Nif-specific regulatory protein
VALFRDETMSLVSDPGLDNNALEALYEIAGAVTDTGKQSEALRVILEILERRLKMSRGSVVILNDNDELLVEASGGRGARSGPVYRRGEGIIGKVVETGNMEIIPRISQEPRFQNRIHRRDESAFSEMSFICAPIKISGEVAGAVSADLKFPGMEALRKAGQILTIVAGIIANDVSARLRARREREILEDENRRLKDELREHFSVGNIIGKSHGMREVLKKIAQVSQSDATVLIRGETGTGKEMAAAAVHYSSNRKNGPFIKVNCSALSEALLESELFGHEKGSFTGAVQRRAGRLEEAAGGTLFLDEIGDFSPRVQVKLLRVIQEREFERVGGNRPLKMDVRLITATHKNLEDAVRDGAFRLDLYYRINVFPIFLPPLRERRDDILLLANHFVEKHSKRCGRTINRISTPAINMLMAYHWPGNVRELENCVEHAVLVSNGDVIYGHDLPPTLQMPRQSPGGAGQTLRNAIETLERDMITDALKRGGGRVTAAAAELGIGSRMLRYKLAGLGIEYEKLFGRGKKSGRPPADNQ